MTDQISFADWTASASAHRRRVREWTVPYRRRRAASQPHPTFDFLFTYYPFSFGKLESWQPGVGNRLELPPNGMLPRNFSPAHYACTESVFYADASRITEKHRTRLSRIVDLLCATQGRKPLPACYALHEWAMVYRGAEVRHAASTPLRLPQEDIDHVVESQRICCTHFDAFRFFHKEALPLNTFQPTLDSRPEMEQPGCLHANMDLYKWASKSMPWIGSDLQWECFQLALKARSIDMRSSPYDVSAYDLPPIRVETPEGRREFEILQQELTEQSRPLRARLIEILKPLSDGAK